MKVTYNQGCFISEYFSRVSTLFQSFTSPVFRFWFIHQFLHIHLRRSALSQFISSLLCSAHSPVTYCFSLVLHYTEQLHHVSLQRESPPHSCFSKSRMNLNLTQWQISHSRVSQRLIPVLQADCRLGLDNRPGAQEGKRSKPRQAGRQTQPVFFWGLSVYCTDVSLCSSSWEAECEQESWCFRDFQGKTT